MPEKRWGMPLAKPPRHRIGRVQVREMGRADARARVRAVRRARASLLCQWYKITDTAQDELSGVRKGRQEPKLLKVPHSRLFAIRDAADIYSEQSTPHRVFTLVQK